jgi:hypothetical protein
MPWKKRLEISKPVFDMPRLIQNKVLALIFDGSSATHRATACKIAEERCGCQPTLSNRDASFCGSISAVDCMLE